MRVAFSSSLLAFAATAAGLRIISPAIDEKVPQDDTITVRWETVSTDPPKMDIYLVNQNSYPNTQEVVATGVDTSLGKYVIKAKEVGDVDTGGGYQVNFVSTTGGGILAQSQQFKVTPSKASEASSSGKRTSTASESLSTSASTHASTSMLSTSISSSTMMGSSTSASHTSSPTASSTASTSATHTSTSASTSATSPSSTASPTSTSAHTSSAMTSSTSASTPFAPFILYVVYILVFHKDSLLYYDLFFYVFHEDPVFFYVIIFFLSHS
ncbi:hypothetical protein N7451_009529 [Penicillium sp. IBT 35674x]|nr:hypothetical protein N7451_009529 [Penicillium sp. IBT 35674x]